MRKILTIVAAPIVLGLSQPAAAQYMPHLDPNLYILTAMMMNNGVGTCGPMSDSEIDEARLPAPLVMQAYFDAAQSGEPVSPMFRLTSKTSWTLGDLIVGEDELDSQSDPLAVTGNTLDTDTLRFFRAGTHQTAQGQWLVLTPEDDVAGVYNGLFQRERGEWKLQELEIFRADDEVAPIRHYCSEPGDLNERRVNGLETQITNLERQLERRQERLLRDEQRAVEAEERAAQKPDSSGRARRAAQRRARADERMADVQETRALLEEARADLGKARTELTEFQAQTTAARNARHFRLLDDEGRQKPYKGEAEESAGDVAQEVEGEESKSEEAPAEG